MLVMLAAALLWAGFAAQAQTAPDSSAAQPQKAQNPLPYLPSGPAPIPLILPKASGPITVFSSKPREIPPDAPDLSEEESFCTTPSSTTYRTKKPLNAEDKKAADRYIWTIGSTIWSHWKIPRGTGDPWRKGTRLRIRFDILDNGSVNDPIVMMTSGRASYDQSALDAIRHSAPFPPPRPFIDESPARVCMGFAYNMDPRHPSDLPEDVFAKKKPSP